MKKKPSLPKNFEAMLMRLKKLDDLLGIGYNPGGNHKEVLEIKCRGEREKLLDMIWENWPRKTFLDKEVSGMRDKALKSGLVREILKKYRIQIEDCAFIGFLGETHIGYGWDCPAHCSPKSMRKSLVSSDCGNVWKADHRYFWGNFRDQVKILFKKSANNRYKVVGVIEMFEENFQKGKKKAA